eukprot:350965-Chlamydomonas_euryale.AAC.2
MLAIASAAQTSVLAERRMNRTRVTAHVSADEKEIGCDCGMPVGVLRAADPSAGRPPPGARGTMALECSVVVAAAVVMALALGEADRGWGEGRGGGRHTIWGEQRGRMGGAAHLLRQCVLFSSALVAQRCRRHVCDVCDLYDV